MYESFLHFLEKPKGEAADQAVGASSPPEKKFNLIVSSLTLNQKKAVVAFLKHQITHLGPEPIDYINEDAKAAYDSYWYQYDPERSTSI